MNDLLAQASRWLNDQRAAHLAGEVTYRRSLTGGQTVDLPIRATIGRTDYQVAADAQASGSIGAQVTDFLVGADQLPDFDPQIGDRIIASGRCYQVQPLGEDTQGWRWSDPHRVTYRIHTRDIGAAP